MATTPNYGWVTPAPTDFVTDLPADFETFADAVDDTVKDLNPGTTAGDLDYYTSSTAKARLGIGTAGQVLKVNSGATAPEWGSISVATPTWSLLNAGGTALSGSASTTISGISGQKQIFVLVVNASSGTAASSLYVRPNGDNAANYSVGGTQLRLPNTYDNDMAQLNTSYSGYSSIVLAVMGNNASSNFGGSVFIDGADTTGWKRFTYFGTGDNGGSGGNPYLLTGQGIWEASATISSVTIVSSAGNFDAGTVYVLGAS